MAAITETQMIQELNAAFPGKQSVALFNVLNAFRDQAAWLDAVGGAITASADEINTLDSPTLTTEAGAGITGGTGTIYKSSVRKVGSLIETRIYIDLTGLGTSTTDLDIIGQGASVAHLGQWTAAQNGTFLAGTMTCLEVPATGADDIDLYAATEGTGVFDGAIGDLAETAIITSGGAWTLALTKSFGADVAANKYLYLCNGEAGTVGTYTAGKFLIVMYGAAA